MLKLILVNNIISLAIRRQLSNLDFAKLFSLNMPQTVNTNTNQDSNPIDQFVNSFDKKEGTNTIKHMTNAIPYKFFLPGSEVKEDPKYMSYFQYAIDSNPAQLFLPNKLKGNENTQIAASNRVTLENKDKIE